ncbi:reverse transcriptase family protein [Bacillus atrophaeus]|uniref:reverse transcriptase family protein n=1 Tax=Bacillus atrophaeus TaxID=1452 RepID=UPI00227F048C|nr:reverse transcriptase family protein [Bacillus atrophaeus]MCY8826132.1 reverse transcriptase family protein [Bacillus atrophaeus]MCY8840504.1 reverse transcriptase family protein [Bacillus atrophaeus]MEC0803656.1 reverse transcriptase family protein [Bacillus atrophaeus]MEC0854149.1 reverse transcriptase family protein [Bacillus atrophaeus]MEC0857351.1 reverse transcriptase family protein [Bacillus atrophaeus]
MIIIFIYKENFFYDYILQDDLQSVKEKIKDKQQNYYLKDIPKKGGLRYLNCIEKETPLYEYQTSLKNKFLKNIPISENAYGFVKGRSYYDFLVPHIRGNKERYFLRIDIKDFFDSITADILEETFKYYFKTDAKTSNEMVELIIDIISLNDVLPQGAVTSPVVSNIVFRQLDIRIQKYCDKLKVVYTRYADDLLFSSVNDRIHEPFFIKMISKILKTLNLNINFSKIKKSKEEISLNGFVVGQNIRISRKKKRDINRVIFIYKDKEPKTTSELLTLLNSQNFTSRARKNNEYFSSKISLLNYLSGYRSFLISWLPRSKQSVNYKSMKSFIKNLEELILNIINLD